ncbi:MAG: RnfABCDGE type electron transport complex subunit D [Porticoccaceae bacterium]
MTPGAPHAHSGLTTGAVMQRVLVAMLPGIAALLWYFGPGTLIQIVLAGSAALVAEALVLRLRGLPLRPTLADGSALVTGVLIGIALPPLAPWWLAVSGSAIAILIAKHPYGGLGYNLFNPAMVAYAALLVSFPDAMAQWPGPRPLLPDGVPPDFGAALRGIFVLHETAPDGFTMATPLELFRHNSGLMVQQLHAAHPLLARGDLAGVGWETVNLGFLAGGVYLLARRVITWHAPVAMLAALVLMALLCNDGGSSASQGPPSLHLFSGATMLGAFFIVTDPITSAASNRGRLLCGLLTGALVFAIRAWGGYPDGLAFAVLLTNLAVPLIDRITVPRAYGQGARHHREKAPE